jgi:hypothetical protein
MKNRNQRVRELMEVIIAASCEAKCLAIEGAIRPEIERTLDQAAKDLKTHVAVTKETQTPLWLKAFGIR